MSPARIPLDGFKDCDVRGVIGESITPELAYRLGLAMAEEAPDGQVLVGGDFRLSTPELKGALVDGLMASGCEVVDVGQLSTPGYYFARRHLDIRAGVMVTASHNPPNHNGFKPIFGDLPISPDELDRLKERLVEGGFAPGEGVLRRVDIREEYVDWLANRFKGLAEKAPKLIFDCGGGATGWALPLVLKRLGLTADVLGERPDGAFSSRSPDISKPGDLAELEREVTARKADLGAAFDGDGDRVGFVDAKGKRVTSDRLVAWLAGELLKREGASPVVFDLKLSRAVEEAIQKYGGQPVPERSGHTFIKTTMLQKGALFGGEYSGHLFYRELDGGDDGLFSALLVASLVAEAGLPFDQLLAEVPEYSTTPEFRLKYSGDKAALMALARSQAESIGARVELLDGVKAYFPEGWALIRASVTEPALTLRFEATDRASLDELASRFLGGLGALGEKALEKIRAFEE